MSRPENDVSICKRIRPWLYCAAEGEATPREAMIVARHIPACTACRILLAREQRLAEMLEGDLEEIPVHESFVRDVMTRLPQGPPPKRRRHRRGLKLAGSAALIGAALIGALGRLTLSGGSNAEPVLPLVTPELAESSLRGFESIRGAVQLVLGVVGTVVTRLPQELPSLSLGLSALLLLAIAACMAAATGSTLFAIAARTLIRLDRQSG